MRTSWLLLVVVVGLLENANVLATTTKGNQATTLSIRNAETETTSKRSLRAHKDTTNNADKEQVHPNKTRPVVDQLQQQKTRDGGKHVHKTAELFKHNAPPESVIVEKTTLVQKYMSIGSKRDKNPNVNPSVNIEMLRNDPAGWREYKKFWKPTN